MCRSARAVTQRADVLAPTRAVEVDGDQPARLVGQQAGRCPPSGALRDGGGPPRLTTQTKRRLPQSAHLTFGFSHTPGRHSFKQRGAHPVLPGLLVLSQRVAKTSDRPRNSDVNSATRPSAVVTSGPPAADSSSRDRAAQLSPLAIKLDESLARSRQVVRRRRHTGIVSQRPDPTHSDGANGRSVRPGRARAFRHALRRLADPRCAA